MYVINVVAIVNNNLLNTVQIKKPMIVPLNWQRFQVLIGLPSVVLEQK